jgi:hypothetical protein
VPENHDFQLLELVRPNAQDRELQNPPKHQITEREEHEASSVVRYACAAYSTHPPLAHAVKVALRLSGTRLELLHPTGWLPPMDIVRGPSQFALGEPLHETARLQPRADAQARVRDRANRL